MVKKFAAIGIALVLIPVAYAAVKHIIMDRTDADREVRAAFVPSGYYLPFIIMKHDNLLEKRGYTLTLSRHANNALMINAFVNGQLDVTAQSAMTMFPIEEKHPGLFRFIYVQENLGYSFVVPEISSIGSLKDLKGKHIGTWQSPTAEVCIKIRLQREGLFPKDYKISRYPAEAVAGALQSGAVDAVFLFDVPCQALVDSGDYRYLLRSAMKGIIDELINGERIEVPVFNGGGFINTTLLSYNPKKALAIRDALLEAVRIINTEPARCRQVLAQELEAPEKAAQKATLDRFSPPQSDTVKSATETLHLLKTAGVVENEFPVENLFWK